ncbi:MAG: hypothetical protein GY795_45725 [Desulfobacterales bacterium]|nr:hypothetical protein [Desulfobacterales bacterium]
MKFWQNPRIQCQNFISALLQIVNWKMKDAHSAYLECNPSDDVSPFTHTMGWSCFGSISD